MSDEEKRVLKSVKEEYKKGIEQGNVLFPIFLNQAKILLNLIEKQQKEIEELKEDNKLLQENYSSAHEDINWFCENHISKKESEQKERKAYIKGTNDADELCNKKWEGKIKAKIEEEDKLFFKTKDVRHANRYKAYKELLEKE